MLRLRLQMEFAQQTCGEAAAALRSLVGPVRSEPGCRSTRFMTEAGDRCQLIWTEEWRSIEDFKLHLRTEAFRRVLAVIELAAGPPVVEIDDVSSRRGFELVEEILSQTRAEQTKYETG